MRMIKLVVIALTSVGISSAAWATPLSQPGWEIDYDLVDSFLFTTICLGSCQTQTSSLGGGSAKLQIENPAGDGFFQDGAPARLSAYDLGLVFNVFGAITDTQVTMLGDANGAFDGVGLGVVWSTPANGWESVGTYYCTAGELCGLAVPETPPAPVTPVNSLGDEAIGDISFNIGVTPPDALMTWNLQPDGVPGFVTLTLHIVGHETGRAFYSTLPSTCTGGPDYCGPDVPEPVAGALVGLGLVGLAVARLRRR
jgi:hypothetical protein